ncbi:MAG TPA: hypothetical protein VLH75_16840 [Longimicrobiales bacterium]|nr:hypothetical protein [Longimicrobiales bacterium]
MNIPPLGAHPLPPAGIGQGRVQGHEPQAGRAASPLRAPAAAEPRGEGRAVLMSAEAPAGTDPKLWSVLTGEERAFFARERALGAITYGPGAAHRSADVPRGGRVDVRV